MYLTINRISVVGNVRYKSQYQRGYQNGATKRDGSNRIAKEGEVPKQRKLHTIRGVIRREA